MSYAFILLLIISLITKKVLSIYISECSDNIDCFNCTLTQGCKWENNTCINFNITEYNETEYNSTEYNTTLLDPKSNKSLFYDLKYIRNTCFPDKVPNKPEENYIYNEISDKYCGNNFIIMDYGRLVKGYKIELKNNSDIYGLPNLICDYVLNHGQARLDVDIFINRSLSQDFLLYYSEDLDNNIQINYSTTLSLFHTNYNSASFLYYSNKTFETSPFIIYLRIYIYYEEESEVLTYLFLAANIGFVVLSIVGIIIVRKCSLFFKLKKSEIKDSGENINEIKGELSIISEKNIEENSRNEMEIDLGELKTIKGNTIDSPKDNKKNEGAK